MAHLIVRLDDSALGRGIWVGAVPAKDLAVSRSHPMRNFRVRRHLIAPGMERIGTHCYEDRSAASVVGNARGGIVDLAAAGDRGGKTPARVIWKMDRACGCGDDSCADGRRDGQRHAEGA